MGQAKRMIEDQYAREAVAKEIAVKADVLKRCEWHGWACDNHGDVESAYRIANAKFTAGEIGDEFENRRQLTDCILQVIRESPIDCPDCENALRD